LRWLRALLDEGVEVHGQVVVCPGINDGEVLNDTLAGVLDEYSQLASLCVVPLGISAHSNEPAMRDHSLDEAIAVVDLVERWQDVYLRLLGRRLAFLADEYYLLAGRPFPEPDAYEGFPMHEDGVGMARAFELEFNGESVDGTGVRPGFFAWVEGAPADGYRAPRLSIRRRSVGTQTTHLRRETVILTGELGARVLEPLVASLGRDDARVLPVENRFFGGNIGVTGLLVGEDLARALAAEPDGHRYLLPDVCLTKDRFLDGMSPDDLPRPVEIVSTDGMSLRKALQ
jgi:NifB/MoaA-like Fe-S oxidoreductase